MSEVTVRKSPNIKVDGLEVDALDRVRWRQSIDSIMEGKDVTWEEFTLSVEGLIQDYGIEELCWEDADYAFDGRYILAGWVRPIPAMQKKIDERREQLKAQAKRARERKAAEAKKKEDRERANYEKLKAKYG